MPVLARLSAVLNADTTRFEAGMKKARKSFKGFGDVVAKGAKASSAAILAVGGALTALSVRQARVIDETAKLSRALGVNIKEFQALALVSAESGITQEQLGTIITKSQRSIVEAARGLETYARSFKTLNLNAQDLMQLSPEDQFVTIANALEKVENDTLRTATALEIFGRSGRQVINVLGDITENLADAREFNDKFGISLSQVDASKVEEMNDTLGRVGQVFAGLGNTIAIEFAPLVTAVSNEFINSGLSAEVFARAVKSGMQTAAIAVDFVRQSIMGMRMIFARVSITVDRFIGTATKNLFNLSRTAQAIPGMGDQMIEVQRKLKMVNQSAQLSFEDNLRRIDKIKKEMREFVPLSEKIARIQAEANMRNISAARRAEQLKNAGAAFNILDIGKDDKSSEISKTKNSLDDLTDSVEDAEKSQMDLNNQIENNFKSMVDGMARGEDAAESFRKSLLNIASSLAETGISSFFEGIFSGPTQQFSKGGVALPTPKPQSAVSGGLFSALGGGVKSFFGSLFPSFDVGSFNVPQDMLANVHKGEMIIPAREAAALRSGGMGGGVDIVQNITIGDNVSAQVRQEIAKAMPDLRRSTIDAVNDARLRGAQV